MAHGQDNLEPNEAGWTTRLGEACLRALGVSALASVPAALRAAGAGGSFLGALLVSTGVLLPIVALTLWLSRAAGRGFRQLVGVTGAGGSGDPAPRAAAAAPRTAVLWLALWIGIATPLLVVLGAVLKATTHHRGLGGGTYGVLALVIAVGTAIVAQRLVDLGRALVARGMRPWIPASVGAAVGVLPLLVVALIARGGDDANGAAVRAAILDGAIVLVATALAATLHVGDGLRRIARMAGVPVAVAVVLGAGARIESSPALARAMKTGGGLAPTILGALERWTDRDGDGVGSHFGGDDCDEGDPGRHPGAPEVAGDGVDQDCDGVDPVRPAAAVTVAVEAPRADRAAGPTVPAASVEKSAPARPDIVLVTLDTVRADHTSPYGYDKDTTPKLAELARRGVLFDHAYAAGGDAQRALAPLASGRRLGSTPHDKREWPTILSETDTIAERLKRSGYRTAAVTSFTWLSEERGFAQGFDLFRPVFTEAHPEREITGPRAIKAALAAWKELEKDATHPVFLWVHLFDAHERYLEHPGLKFGKGRAGMYDGEVAFVDRMLGDLVAAIGASPRASRVAWIVHGSQGEGLGEHDFNGHAGEVYDEALRVPLVIALPDGKPGKYEADAVSVIDVPATVADLAGIGAEGLEGASLAPIARGDLARRHGPVYARSQRKVALIEWPLKLMVFERKKNERSFLFDLAADPREKEDLSTSRQADLERLLKARSTFEPGRGEGAR